MEVKGSFDQGMVGGAFGPMRQDGIGMLKAEAMSLRRRADELDALVAHLEQHPPIADAEVALWRMACGRRGTRSATGRADVAGWGPEGPREALMRFRDVRAR